MMFRLLYKKPNITMPTILLVIILTLTPFTFIFTQDIEPEFLEEISKCITPEEMICNAAQKNKIIMFGEIHIMAQPKELLTRTIKKLHFDYGFNYLVLEIGENYQYLVDEYLETGNELILRKNPWTLFSPWHASEQYIKIYKAVYQINKVSKNKMKIICADYDPIKYSENYELIRNRDEHIMEILQQEIFTVDKAAKVVIFIGAYHVIKNNVWEYMKEFDPFGVIFEKNPLGFHLNKAFPNKVFSIYIDGIIPKDIDEDGLFLTDIGILYKKQMITMVPVPFALLVENNISISKFNVMSKIPIASNFDGYIFAGPLEKLKLIDIEDWKSKKDKN